MIYNNAEELRAAFIEKGWRDPRFELVSADDIKNIFGFAAHFITGPVYRMLGTGKTGRGNIYDCCGKIVFYDIPVLKEAVAVPACNEYRPNNYKEV